MVITMEIAQNYALRGQMNQARAVENGISPGWDTTMRSIMNTADELQKLYELHQAGALSDEEYAEAKAKLLAGSLSHPAATTPERQQELRHWAMVLHLSLLAGLLVPVAGMIVPILLWLMKRESLPELDSHGKVIANWAISALIYGFVFGMLSFILIGIPLLWLLGFLSLIFPIIAAIKASNGELWPYPLSFTFFS